MVKEINLDEISKNNKYINIEKIKEVTEYLKEMKPFIKESSYDIGVPEEKNFLEQGFSNFSIK